MAFNRKQWHKDYYKKHRESLLRKQKQYYEDNRKEVLAKNKKWSDNNKERHKRLQKTWYENNKPWYKEKNREYKQLHKEHYKEVRKKYFSTEQGKNCIRRYIQKRRQAKNNIIETFSIEEWMEKVNNCNNICPSCGKLAKGLTLDHIYPISKANKEFLATGIKRIYTIKDVQPLCRSCNSKKQDR